MLLQSNFASFGNVVKDSNLYYLIMVLQRLTGTFFGLHLRLWTFLLLLIVCVLTVYRYLDGLHNQILILGIAKLKLEKAVIKLQGEQLNLTRKSYTADDDLYLKDNDVILIYNRVPKTGSTSFAGIAYDLCTTNRFHVIHVNISRNQRVLGLSDQMRFIKNITGWEQKKPALYHGHISFIDFSRFGVQKLPIYINMVREPLDRLVSYYYFVRYGDDFRPSLRRRKSGDHESFDECVARDGKDCDPENLWVQVPYFCGHHADCWEPGSSWALEEAKRNLLHHYLLVGITEELRDFIAILEATLPRFFRGASQLYAEGHDANRRKRKKIWAKPSTLAKLNMSTVWKVEKDFFEFAAKLFHYHKRLVLESHTGKGNREDKRFHFGKVRPKESEDIKLMT